MREWFFSDAVVEWAIIIASIPVALIFIVVCGALLISTILDIIVFVADVADAIAMRRIQRKIDKIKAELRRRGMTNKEIEADLK